MKLTRLARYTVLGMTLAFGLAAWSADSHTNTQANATIPFQIYVGFFNGQQVDLYKPGRSGPTSKVLLDGLNNITGAIAVDKLQNVYVTTAAGWVVMYPSYGVVPMQRYMFQDKHQPPLTLGITLDQAGTLYAALYNDGIVAEYTAGNPAQASFTVGAPPPYTPLAVAVDRQNNLYMEYALVGPFPQTAYIEKCPPQSNQCTDLGIQLGAGGWNLAVDGQGNIVACDELASQIDVFPPNGGQPRVISQGLNGCGFFALDSSDTYLVVGNESHNWGPTSISIFNYASGALMQNITAGVPQNDFLSGVALAVSPTAAP